VEVVVVVVALEGGRLVRVDRRVGRELEEVCVVTEGSVEVVEGLEEGREEEEEEHDVTAFLSTSCMALDTSRCSWHCNKDGGVCFLKVVFRLFFSFGLCLEVWRVYLFVGALSSS